MNLLYIVVLLAEGSCIDMTLYKVTCYDDIDSCISTFDVYVYAYNIQQAINIVNEEVWTISGMSIKEVVEVEKKLGILCIDADRDE